MKNGNNFSFVIFVGGLALQEGDFGGAGFLGKRLNYRMVLNVCFKQC